MGLEHVRFLLFYILCYHVAHWFLFFIYAVVVLLNKRPLYHNELLDLDILSIHPQNLELFAMEDSVCF